jgi:hypothetical protein
MTTSITIPSDASQAQINMIVGALYLSLARCISHIPNAETAQEAEEFKQNLVSSLKSGEIDMAILDDSASYELVVSMVEGLASNIEAQGDPLKN